MAAGWQDGMTEVLDMKRKSEMGYRRFRDKRVLMAIDLAVPSHNDGKKRGEGERSPSYSC